MDESRWREFWVDTLACAAGFSDSPGSGKSLISYLSQNSKRIVFIIDGLEDLFQNLSDDESQKTALRSLLQEVPDWLSQQPGVPAGLIVFVRQDIVIDAIRQNSSQLIHKYKEYALSWSWTDALRLVSWMCNETKVLGAARDDLYTMAEADLKEYLVPFWGRKLGADGSREARSTEWILSALSGPRSLIQARDLVRLTAISARLSIDKMRWTDRILAPESIRDSLPECSREKVREISDENSGLKRVFERLRRLESNLRITPFEAAALRLDLDDIKLLEHNGVLVRAEDKFDIPEIFRHGLDFARTGRARPRVLGYSDRAFG